ncbi:MAG TPA: diguanylate cyclase [Novosphingobium sp.]|nr:diguanylate cyclase [Novosphingobium sp.]
MRRRPAHTSAFIGRDTVQTGLAYFVGAALALQLTRFDGGVAIVWLASAILLARLSSMPRRRWGPMVLTCAPLGILAVFLFGYRGAVSIPLALVGVGEAWISAWLLLRLCPRFVRFHDVGQTLRFLAVAGVLAPMCGAFVGAWCAHQAGGLPFWPVWRDWYAAHALGLVTFTPPLLMIMRGEMAGWLRRPEGARAGEAAGLLGAVLLAALATFGQSQVPLVVVPFVPMIAATFRLGRFGAVSSILILTAVGLACSLAGVGPTALLHVSMALKFQVLQIYFACVVMILLPLAAELKARRRLFERLRAAEALHRLVLERTSDVMMRLGSDGAVRYASPPVRHVWGYAPEELLGRALPALVPDEDNAAVNAACADALTGSHDTAPLEHRIIRHDGSHVWVESHMCATLDAQGRPAGIVAIFREITERRQLMETLAHQAMTDPLTALANRRAFDEALAACLDSAPAGEAQGEPARPGCLAIFDLDHFKQVNDVHGHATGDRVLVRFAAVLRASVRGGDVVARLGGEEFAVLLAGASVEQARLVCDRIRLRLAASEELALSGAPVHVTVSAGITVLAPGDTLEAVKAAADAALYRAKNSGRNQLAIAA